MNKHWCHNRKPFKDSLMVQDGWTEDGRRIMKEIPFRLSMNCEWSKEHDNERCDGCKHKMGPTKLGTD